MSITKLIQAILTLSILASCGKSVKLSDKAFKWMPYKGNETLVFNSSNGKSDTIFLLKKDTLIAYPEAQSISGTTYEVVSIFCRHSDPSPPNGEHRYLENTFVELSAGKENEPYLTIHLKAKDACFYGNRFLYLKDLSTVKQISLSTKSGIYNDVLMLLPESNQYTDRSNFLTKVYWSKSEGIVRFDKKDSTYWELTNKYGP